VQAYPGITQSTLCSQLDIEPSRMVGLVHDLEKRGFAVRVRCKADRRSHGLFLTKPGEAELAEDCARAERSLAANNDPAEQQRLIRLTQARAPLATQNVLLSSAPQASRCRAAGTGRGTGTAVSCSNRYRPPARTGAPSPRRWTTRGR
jgi:hypothetical protein